MRILGSCVEETDRFMARHLRVRARA
jgi:hypothetical protein